MFVFFKPVVTDIQVLVIWAGTGVIHRTGHDIRPGPRSYILGGRASASKTRQLLPRRVLRERCSQSLSARVVHGTREPLEADHAEKEDDEYQKERHVKDAFDAVDQGCYLLAKTGHVMQNFDWA